MMTRSAEMRVLKASTTKKLGNHNRIKNRHITTQLLTVQGIMAPETCKQNRTQQTVQRILRYIPHEILYLTP